MSGGALARASDSALAASRGAFIALGISIPVATALDGILTVVILVAWLIAARLKETIQAARENPVALAACIWFAAHVLGATYSIGPPRDAWGAVREAAIFLLIPIGAVILRPPRDVRLAHALFMGIVALTVVLSTFRWIGVIPADAPLLKPTGFSGSVVFKNHLTQNILVAFGAFVFAVYAREARTRRTRFALAACAALAVTNVLVMGDGRTGQVLLLVLIVYYGGWCFGAKGLVGGLFAAIAAGAIAYAIPGSSLHSRTKTAVSEAAGWESQADHRGTSVGERLDFAHRSLQIIARHPVLGVGSGGFATADRQQTEGTTIVPTTNPHNQYLLQAAELGVIGPLLMVGLFWVQWRTAARLVDPRDTGIARGLVLAFAVGCLANSMFRDHVEGLLFVWMSALVFSGLRTGGSAKPNAR